MTNNNDKAKAAAAARAHFQDTTGYLPESVRVLSEHAPHVVDGYLVLREYVHAVPPEGHLDVKTRELLFTVLDVVAGHVEGAKAHVESGLRAGLTIGELTQALTIAMMVSGIHTWAIWGHEVVDHAAKLAAADAAGG